MRLVGLILAKSKSNRLPGKNTVDFLGRPMFLTNVEKCLRIFDDVYVSSDSLEILELARKNGAKPILRDEELCGDTPNIPVYRHALRCMGDVDGIVAVQANSPTVAPNVITLVKKMLEFGADEVMTCHKDYSIYGSVWGLSIKALENYLDPYRHSPDVLILDPSVDVHTKEDLKEALCQLTAQ